MMENGLNRIGRGWVLVELALVTLTWSWMLWSVLWVVGSPLGNASFFVLFLLLTFHVVLVSPKWIHRDSRDMHGVGVARDGFSFGRTKRDSVAYLSLFTASATLVIVLVAWILQPNFSERIVWKGVLGKFLIYFPSALGQAILFFEFYLVRLKAAFGARAAVLGTALVFSLFHLPNLPLMGVTLIAALFWGHEYARRPNLFLLVPSHMFLGTVLNQVVHFPMRSGPLYYQQDRFIFRELFPWYGDISRWFGL